MRRRRFHWGRDLSREPGSLPRVVNTPKPCSCLLCGNARRHAGPTMQERRAMLAANDDEGEGDVYDQVHGQGRTGEAGARD